MDVHSLDAKIIRSQIIVIKMQLLIQNKLVSGGGFFFFFFLNHIPLGTPYVVECNAICVEILLHKYLHPLHPTPFLSVKCKNHKCIIKFIDFR